MPSSAVACPQKPRSRLAVTTPSPCAKRPWPKTEQVYRLKHDPDRLLVRACQRQRLSIDAQDDPFRVLIERYQTRVFRLCHDLTGNFQDALDTTQETFARAFRRLDTFLFQSKFAHWLYRIATNACIDLRRATRIRSHISIEAMQLRTGSDARSISLPDSGVAPPSEALTRSETNGDVHRAIKGLSQKLKEIVLLRYFENLSYEDIRERLGVSMGTVKSRLFRAHETLQYWLEPAMQRHRA